MKKIILSVLLASLILHPLYACAKTTTIKKYDSKHKYVGKYISDGNGKTKIYNSKNKYEGYLKESNGRVKEYDAKGKHKNSYKIEDR